MFSKRKLKLFFIATIVFLIFFDFKAVYALDADKYTSNYSEISIDEIEGRISDLNRSIRNGEAGMGTQGVVNALSAEQNNKKNFENQRNLSKNAGLYEESGLKSLDYTEPGAFSNFEIPEWARWVTAPSSFGASLLLPDKLTSGKSYVVSDGNGIIIKKNAGEDGYIDGFSQLTPDDELEEILIVTNEGGKEIIKKYEFKPGAVKGQDIAKVVNEIASAQGKNTNYDKIMENAHKGYSGVGKSHQQIETERSKKRAERESLKAKRDSLYEDDPERAILDDKIKELDRQISALTAENKQVAEAINRNATDGTSGYCVWWDKKIGDNSIFSATIGNCIEQLLYFVLYLISVLVGIAGSLFNLVFTKTVVEMSSWVGQVGAIDIAWRTMRDLANISFIFILLYLAISTILGLDEHGIKHTLSKLIIVAVLINFSLFFTKVFIDASNIVAINFYNQINPVLGEDSSAGNRGDRAGMGDVFMSVFKVHTIYSAGGNLETGAQQFAAGKNAMAVFFAGAIFLMLTFALLLASLMVFIKRFIILILVMVFAPVAFAGSILHATEHHLTGEWWKYLLKESIFAPIYMIMLWVVLQIITSIEFKNAIGFNTGATFAGALNDPAGFGAAGVFLNFFVAGTALVAILIVAEHMGVAGAHGMIHTFKGITAKGLNAYATPFNALYRDTIGAGAYGLIEKTRLAKWTRNWQAGGGPAGLRWALKPLGGAIDSSLKGIAKSSLKPGSLVDDHAGGHGGEHGADGSFVSEKYAKIEAMKGALYEVRDKPEEAAKMYAAWANGDFNTKVTAQKLFEEDSRKAQAELISELDNQGDVAASKFYRDRLSEDEKDEADRIIEEDPLTLHRRQFQKYKDAIADATRSGNANLIRQAETNLKEWYAGLRTRQKIGLKVEQRYDPLVADLNESNVAEQDQRGQRLRADQYSEVAKIGFNASDRVRVYEQLQNNRTNEALKRLFARKIENQLFVQQKLAELGKNNLDELMNGTDAEKQAFESIIDEYSGKMLSNDQGWKKYVSKRSDYFGKQSAQSISEIRSEIESAGGTWVEERD